MRFHKGVPRIIDYLRPHPLIGDGGNYYLMASWRSKKNLGQYFYAGRSPWKPKPNQIGGWLPGRHRWAGLKPMLRVINPAVRYMPATRQANEIRARRERFFYPWDKRRPVRRQTA